MPGNGSPLSSHTSPPFPKYGWMYLAIQKCSKDVSIYRCQTHPGVRTKTWRQRIHHGVQAKSAAVDVGGCRAELSFCFSMAKSSCTANQWEQEIRLNAQERGIRDLQILPSTSVLELGEPDMGEAGENKKCVWPRVLCQTWLLDAEAAAEHLCAEMTPLCSLAGYLKSDRCGLISIRSPPRGWQKSVIGSITSWCGGLHELVFFFLSFLKEFLPATLLSLFIFCSCEGEKS